MLSTSSRLLLLGLLLQVVLIAAQDEQLVNPNQACSQATRDQMQTCLDQVESDEAKLASGPCTSTDWSCICTKQQGLVDCYSACSGLSPVDMVRFNQNSCSGQHGVTIRSEGGSLSYTWSTLPLTSSSSSSPNLSNVTTSTVPAYSNTTGTSALAPTFPANDGSATATLSSTSSTFPTSTTYVLPSAATNSTNTSKSGANGSPFASAAILALVCISSIYAIMM